MSKIFCTCEYGNMEVFDVAGIVKNKYRALVYKSRVTPRESREKNQRETEEMYKSLGSGFNPRQNSISCFQRFFL